MSSRCSRLWSRSSSHLPGSQILLPFLPSFAPFQQSVASFSLSTRTFKSLSSIVVHPYHVSVNPSSHFHRYFSVEASSPPPPSHSGLNHQNSSNANPISFTSSVTPQSPSSSQLYRREHIEDVVMGVLTRYTSKPIRDLELTTKLEDLESATLHDSSHAEFFPPTDQSIDASSESPNNSNTSTVNRRMWDCLDTVEFMLDMEKMFSIEIPDSTADAVQTPEDAVKAIYDLLQQQGRIDSSAK